ncbi:Uncharacterised protein [Mycobacteroides abscessus subsp. abscessus]|nr:Uncharacterised protein [Mycobacteroides abscessus subsp. abscessus]
MASPARLAIDCTGISVPGADSSSSATADSTIRVCRAELCLSQRASCPVSERSWASVSGTGRVYRAPSGFDATQKIRRNPNGVTSPERG